MKIKYGAGETKFSRASAPLRIGLGGGGTDIPEFIDRHGGLVLNSTISLSANCTVYLSQTDRFIANDLGISEHEKLPLHRATLEYFTNEIIMGQYPQHNHTIVTSCDAPVGSGLGSSSAIVVAIFAALCEFYSISMTREELVKHAIKIEREILNFSGGYQDQVAAVYGGFNYIEFESRSHIIVNSLKLEEEVISEFQASIILYFSGGNRVSADVIDSQTSRITQNDQTTIQALLSLKKTADKMRRNLVSGNVGDFWTNLNRSWISKKDTSSVISNKLITKIEDVVFNNDGLAMKLSGAGGGGFCLISCLPESRINLISQLETLGGTCVPFQFVETGVKTWTINR